MVTAEEKAREREKRARSLFTAPNRYSYQLNVNNPVINKFYEDYIRRFGILRPPSDRQRADFETALWRYLRMVYKKYDSKAPDFPPLPQSGHISELVFGWREEYIELFVNNTLNADKAVMQFRRWKIGGEYRD